MKGIKGLLAVGIASVAMVVGVPSAAEDTAVTRGFDWLQAQVQSNGAISSERESLAVVEQVRTEAAHTLAQGGRTTALPDLAPSELSDLSTELLARRVIGLGAIGRTEDASEVLLALLQRANGDGGFGGAVTQPSNPLDTSLALLAMRAGGVFRTARAQAALGYLGGAASADGSYSLGRPTYVTGYALQAFTRFRNEYSLATSIQRTRTALIAQQVGGAYGDSVDNAVAVIALAQSGPVTDAAGPVSALRSAQHGNGSWNDDPYVTALALRALLVASNAPSIDAGRILGEVYDASSGLPIGQALVTVSGLQNTAVTDPETGAFVLGDIPAGTYSVTVSHIGYAPYTGAATVNAGGTTSLGRIYLSLAEGTAALRGRVTESTTATPLAGVAVQLTGALSTQTQTNAQGEYELVGLPAGSYSIQLELVGYEPLTQDAELPSRTVVTFSPSLTPEGEAPPTDASAIGVVVKATDGSPLIGAQVRLNGQSATSDADGLFRFAGLVAGAFDGDVQAEGHDSVSFSGILANGANDLGRITLSETQSPRRTLIGVVTSSATGMPVAGAMLTLNGAPAGLTDASGQYRIEDTASQDVELVFDAAGYQSRTALMRLENPGTYRVDAQLDDLLEGTFQVLNLRTTPSSALPGETMRITADIANLTADQKPALVLVRLLDNTGMKVAQFCGAELAGLADACEYEFEGREVKPFVSDWTVTNLPAGDYTLAVHVVQPGTIQRNSPLGLIYGIASRQIQVKPALGLQGLVTSSPPVMIPNSPNGVDFAATVQNKGNDIIPAGEARLSVIDRADGVVAHSVTIATSDLLPNDIVELDFGHWAPEAAGAQYDLQVVSTNPVVGGVVTGEFYIGDAATGEFTVTPTETAEGDQLVEATLTVKGVNNPSGQAADPLFTLVRQAVTRGGAYTASNALNWQRSNNCLGCHIQTQSLYGLASSLDKADVSQAAALYLQNSQSATIHSDRAIDTAQAAGYRVTPTMLALWSMTAWPDRNATFNARFRMADYLYGRRGEYAPTNGAYWWYDHPTGWLTDNPASTATVVEGIASVLNDAARFGKTRIHEYRAVNRAATAARLVDIAGASNGQIYALQADGKIYEYNPETQASSLFATAKLGSSYYAIAVGQGDALYVSSSPKSGQPPVLERVTPTENLPIATLPAAFEAIDTTHDFQVIGLNRASRSVYLVDPAAGTHRKVASAGLIPAAAESLTAAANGDLIVTNVGIGAVQVTRTGTQKRIFEGNLYPLRDLVLDSNGRGYAAGSNAIYDISSAGVIERFTGGGGKIRLALAGERLFGISANSTQIVELERLDIDISARLSEMRIAVEKAARHFETYINYGVPSEAFRLIILAEARPHITDQALLAKVDARIPQLKASLRAAQQSDGGWRRYSSGATDPLTTAIVGTALDYTHPEPTDPVLRKSVQYLLTKQASDGSWTGQYFSTRLGATSYVMAYLPKAVARLGGINVGLGIEFGPEVQLLGSSVNPDSSIVNADGSAAYFFNLGRINATGATFVFSLKLVALKVDEWRKIASSAFLRFINSFNGEVVEAPIAIPTVHVVSKYQLSLTLNDNLFHANEDVLVEPTVRNNGSSYTSGSLRYFIETAAGAPVTELPVVAFSDIATGAQRTLPQPWNTSTTRAGDYRARVVLLGPDGQVWGEAIELFRIITTSTGPQIGSSVATDRAVYDPFDTVVILGKVRNLTLNSRYEQLTVTEVVRMPDGSELFTADRAIPVLEASRVQALTVPFNLLASPAGAYIVTQYVRSVDLVLLDTQVTSFVVRSTSGTGAGLSGTIAAVPAVVESGLATSLVVAARNEGNAGLVGLPLIVSIIDPATEMVLASWTRVYNLPLAESVGYSLSWSTAGVAPGDYTVVLQASLTSGLKTLDYGPVKVIEPPIKVEMHQEVTASGRVLVLMTCRVGTGVAEDAECTNQRATFVDALLTRMAIEHKVVTTTDGFAQEHASGRYDTYWVSGGAQKLANSFAEELREAVFQGDGLLVDGNHDSRNQILDDALGVNFHGQLSGNLHRAVMSGEFDVGSFDVLGDVLVYRERTAQIAGNFDSITGPPAFLVNRYGEGRSTVAAFDLVAALTESASAVQAEALLARALDHVLPESPAYGLSGGYLTVRSRVHNLANAVELLLRGEVVSPMRLEDAWPVAETITAGVVQWRFPLAVDEIRQFQMGLRLPVISGTYALDSSLRVASDPLSTPVANHNLSILVARPHDIANLLEQDLARLVLSSQEHNARTRVRTLLASAMIAFDAGQRDQSIAHLLKAIDELAKIRSVDTTDVHVYLATLVKAARVVPHA